MGGSISIIDWGLLKNKTDPDFSGKSRSDSCVSRLRPSNLASAGKVHKAEFIQSVDRFGVFKTARVF